MFGVGFDSLLLPEFLKTVAVILLMGGVVKLVDDFLDLRYDIYIGSQSLAVRLGEGTLPYGLIGFTAGVMVDAHLAAAIMVGAYTIGMMGELNRQLPSGLAGYQESMIILALAFVFIPWTRVVWAVFAMLAVQIADDLCDLDSDRWSGNPNLVRTLGRVESYILGMIALVVAAMVNPGATALTFASIPLILWAYRTAAHPSVDTRGWTR